MPFISQREATDKEPAPLQAWASSVTTAMVGAEARTRLTPPIHPPSHRTMELGGPSLLGRHQELPSVTRRLLRDACRALTKGTATQLCLPGSSTTEHEIKEEKKEKERNKPPGRRNKNISGMFVISLFSLSPSLTHTLTPPQHSPLLLLLLFSALLTCREIFWVK